MSHAKRRSITKADRLVSDLTQSTLTAASPDANETGNRLQPSALESRPQDISSDLTNSTSTKSTPSSTKDGRTNTDTTRANPTPSPTLPAPGLISTTVKPRSSPVPRPSRLVPNRTASDSVTTKKVTEAMPRTSSIDSAISSLSTSSNPHNATSDLREPSSEEITCLIDTAGSAEGLIQHLLREKAHTAQQNAQLWKLVDKQRALLLGLNKDLERLAKEKDRYKRKLREVQTSVPLPQVESLRKSSQSPVQNSNDMPHQPPSSAIHQTPEGKRLAPQYRSSPIDPEMLPQPLQFGNNTQVKPPSQLKRSDTDTSIEDSDHGPDTPPRPVNITVSTVEGSDTSAGSQPSPTAMTQNPTMKLPSLITSIAAPSLNLIEPSPMAEKNSKSFSTARKAPAPLVLKHSSNSSTPVHSGDATLKGPDHPMGLIDSPPVERGRRKTREADDKEREIAVLKEQEARSQSKMEQQNEPKILEAQPSLPPTSEVPAEPQPSQSLPLAPATTLDRPNSSGKASNPALLAVQGSGNVTERHLTAPLRSPGLPLSPRPGDRPLGSPLPRIFKDGAPTLSALPGSPRAGITAFPLTPRAPRSAIPLPPGSKLNNAATLDEVPETNSTPAQQQMQATPMSPTGEAPSIYRGLMSSAYPDLLLPPNALPSIEIKVASSRLRPPHSQALSRHHDQISIFTLSVFSRSDARELWRLGKSFLSLSQLDQSLRLSLPEMPKLPEKKLFEGHAPAVVDARRSAINTYFDELLDTPMNENIAVIICRFLSVDAVDPLTGGTNRQGSVKSSNSSSSGQKDGKPTKTGYLTKRGKNFGGWKSRYYVLESPELRCYDTVDGQHLGTIKLPNAQIGRQSEGSEGSSPTEDADENEFRHAILILEPKKKDSNTLVKHVLCAESDAERDEWVEALLHYVHQANSAGSSPAMDKESSAQAAASSTEHVKTINYADTTAGLAPVMKSPVLPVSAATPRFGQSYERSSGQDRPVNISGPTGATVIKDASSWGNKPEARPKESRMRSIFHFKQRPSTDSASSNQPNHEDAVDPMTGRSRSFNAVPVFGLSLAEAVDHCSPVGKDVPLPAVVYRCIEYLQATQAANEEGLFRVNGSSAVIKGLKERFNQEGDFQILGDAQYNDVHAIASLLKLYLRELPPSVLTRELHLDFVKVTELDDHVNRVTAFNSLVHQLPQENFVLLRTLSAYLLEVVQHSSQNKMSVRNLAIVFSPTLNLQVPIITMFLTEFDAIFDQTPTAGGPVRPADTQAAAPDDIRSPRRQLFTELPTPAYSQTHFSHSIPHSAFPPTPKSAQMPHQGHETGFAPLPQTSKSHLSPYPASSANIARQTMQHIPNNEAAYGSLNRMMAPTDAQNDRARRRESSMLFM